MSKASKWIVNAIAIFFVTILVLIIVPIATILDMPLTIIREVKKAYYNIVNT